MKKVLISTDYGGFFLANAFQKALAENEKTKHYTDNSGYGAYVHYETENSLAFREDPDVIALFEKMFPKGMPGIDSSGAETDRVAVSVVEVDEDRFPDWYIVDHDGKEFINLKVVNHGFKY